MRRLLLAFMLTALCVVARGQRRLVVVDVETRVPIRGVNVVSNAHKADTTDWQGLVTVPDSCRSLSLSHVKYESRILNVSEVQDTIFLISKLMGLPEVTVLGQGKNEDRLKELLESKSKEPYRRIIVYTHTHIWKLDGSQGHTSNMALEETYELSSLLADYKIPYVWCGHQHARQSVFFKGVNYLVLNATKDSEKGQSYLKVDMGDAAIYHYIDYPSIDNL